MSLRAKIVLSVLLVNAAVTALLAVFFSLDLRDKREELQLRQQREAQEASRTVERNFGQHFLEESLLLEVSDVKRVEAAEIRWRLMNHQVKEDIADGLVLNSAHLLLSKTPGWAESGARPTDLGYSVCLNLMGAKERAPGFDRQLALAAIQQAIQERRFIRGPKGRWFAAPIRLKGFLQFAEDVDFSEEPWGGGFFVLNEPPPTEEWVPSFGENLGWVMGLGTLLLVGLTWLLLEKLVLQPMAELGRGSRRVAQGRYDQPVAVSPSGDEIGRLVGSFNSMMTQVADSERDLNERVREATRREEDTRRGLMIAQRLAATGTLASGIAHEINNPLGGLLNATNRLRQEAERRQDEAAPRDRKYLELIHNGLQRIREIVRRVLTFSPRATQPVEVGVKDLVQQSVALAEHRARKVGVPIEVHGVAGTLLVVPGEVQQVLLNLLLNACDAMEGRRGSIQVRCEQHGPWIDLIVQDAGPGLDATQRERVFDLFYSTKEVGRGTGLGLSVAHHIVEQHGGTLTVDSEPGEGARFRVRLPAAGSA